MAVNKIKTSMNKTDPYEIFPRD